MNYRNGYCSKVVCYSIDTGGDCLVSYCRFINRTAYLYFPAVQLGTIKQHILVAKLVRFNGVVASRCTEIAYLDTTVTRSMPWRAARQHTVKYNT